MLTNKPGSRKEASGFDREAMYRAVIETSADGFHLLDAEGCILEVNDAYVKRSGYSRDELLAMRITDLEAKECPDETASRIMKVIRNGSDIFESLHRAKDGTVWQVEVNVSYWNIGSGRFCCFIRDITGRKQAEEALLDSEEKFRAIYNNIGIGVALIGKDMQILSINRQMQKWFPHIDSNQHHLCYQSFNTPPRTSVCDYCPTVLTLKDGQIHSAVTDTPTGDSVRHYKVTASPLLAANGSVVAAIEMVEDITDRRIAEKELREKESRYRLLFEAANDGIFIMDATGFKDCNQRGAEMYRLPRAEIIGRLPADLAPERQPDGRLSSEVVGEKIQAALGGVPQLFEWQPLRADGIPFDVEITLSRLEFGGAVSLQAIVRDITERKRAEERLKKINGAILNLTEHDHRGNLSTLTTLCGELLRADCVLYNRLDGNLLCVMGQWAGPVDLKKEDAPRGHICFDVISRDSDQPLVVRNLQDTAYANTDPNVAAYGLQTYIGCRVRYGGNARGSLCAVFTRDYEPSSNDLDVIGIIAAAIAQEEERHAAEEKLRRSEELVRNILDTVDEGFIVVDPHYRILTANRAYCNLVNCCDEKIIGSHCYEMSHKINRPCYDEGEDCAVRKVFETGKAHAALHCHKDANNNILYVETKAYPVKDASGVVTSVIETINNITERYLLEEERLKTQKLESIGTLAGGIAHDFNNLLQGVFGYISMAKMTLGQREKSFAMLEQAEEALHMSVNLTTQLLTFAKGGKPVKKVIRLEPAVENAVKFALSGSHTNYRLDIAPDLWQIEADTGQLAQVIQNIVLNASEAMAGRGTVHISAENMVVVSKAGPRLPEGGRFVRIDIQDTGTGIPEQNLAKIFDPYFTTKQKGSGLGLATSYSIIRNHGGVIEVTSGLNKGTTFTIYLPGAISAEREAGTTAAATFGAKQGRILLMDDEDVVRRVATEMIAALGHDVEVAENGGKAIALFRQAKESGKPYDLVILDLTIKGGMGGEEAIQKILEIDPNAKAVVSSGYADNPVVAHYRDYGFSAFLNKPYKLADLKECLNSSLQ
ncbi:MAG: PAS domain S-box protein [Thermodesulfovibrionales bacterium]